MSLTRRVWAYKKLVVHLSTFGALLFSCLVSSKCVAFSGFSENPPTKTFTIPASFKEAWRASLMTLIAESIPIESQDQERGTIKTAKFPIQKKEFQKWADQAFLASDGYGRIEVRVIPMSGERTTLEIVTQFQGGATRLIRREGRYYQSTGIFENQLAARIHMNVVLRKYPKLIQLVTGCNFRWNEEIEHYEISGVEPGSLGEAQGFQNGDIVIQVDGIDMTMENFFAALTAVERTETKVFFLDRGGKGILLEATIFYLPQDLPWFGFQVERNIETGRFQVSGVVKNSPADQAGLKVGDLLLQEEQTPLSGWYEYYGAVSGARMGVDRNFLVWRDGSQYWLTMRTEPQTG